MTQDALSQDDIDRLLKNLAAGDTTALAEEAVEAARTAVSQKKPGGAGVMLGTLPPKGHATGPRRIRDYDFRRPNRISKESIRGLRLVFENFARESPRVWGPILRAGGQFKILSMEETIYDEYRNHLSPHSFFCTATMPPLTGEFAFQFDSEAAFVIVDRMLGGQGTGMNQMRDLTIVELALLQRVISALMPTWRIVWLPIIHLEPVVERTLTGIDFLQITGANESVLVTTMQARFLNNDIEITICIPYAVIAPILSRIVATEHHAEMSGNSEQDHERLLRRMQTMSMEVSARLGAAPIPIAELSELAVGDVIRLDVPVEGGLGKLVIGDLPYFVARPGLSHGNMAMQVTGVERRD
jgi:flagellar motor switch protein FliM